MRLPAKVEHWDDERDVGNGIIVTLHYGHCFDDPGCHVQGFDTVREARQALKYTRACNCVECREACRHEGYITRRHPERGEQPFCPACDEFVEL